MQRKSVQKSFEKMTKSILKFEKKYQKNLSNLKQLLRKIDKAKNGKKSWIRENFEKSV